MRTQGRPGPAHAEIEVFQLFIGQPVLKQTLVVPAGAVQHTSAYPSPHDRWQDRSPGKSKRSSRLCP